LEAGLEPDLLSSLEVFPLTSVGIGSGPCRTEEVVFQQGPAKAAQQHPGRCSVGSKTNNICCSGRVHPPVVFQYGMQIDKRDKNGSVC